MNDLLQKSVSVLRERGPAALWRKSRWHLEQRREDRNYQRWITERESRATPSDVAFLDRKPLISVIVPVYNVDGRWLRRCLDSVREQIYENWELCIADDKSPGTHIREILDEYAAVDNRVKVAFRDENGHIAAASNSALELADGEFTVLLDHDDELSPDALFWVARTIADSPETAFIYSDEDLIDENGRRSEPKFKPDFSRDLLYSLNLITHLSAYKTELLKAVGGFRIGTEGSQDYDLALRVIERIDESRIRHIPRILYHWRTIRGSVAFAPGEKPYAFERAREVIAAHFERTGVRASVSETFWNLNRVRYELPDPPPQIGVVAIESGDAIRNDHPNVVVAQVPVPRAADLNRAAGALEGDLLCFVNSQLTPSETDWLSELASLAMQPGIGAVGGKIVDGNDRTVAGGIVFGGSEIVRPAHGDFPDDAPGNMCRNRVISNYSAVSIDCLMIRRELFDEIGGFDENAFPTSLFDADLCLRLRDRGLRIAHTPYAELRGDPIERASDEAELRSFRERWSAVIDRDPFYNPNLSRSGRTFAIDVE